MLAFGIGCMHLLLRGKVISLLGNRKEFGKNYIKLAISLNQIET
jgi:hypothetical protein